MAWIESHQQLLRHPKTARLARLLSISLPTAIGHLHCFWWWAMDYAQDGSLAAHDEIDIATAAMWDGDEREFFDAMVRAGFIDLEPPQIHDWPEYAGRLIERRKADAERKRAGRRTESSGRPADVQRTSERRRTESVVTVPNLTVPNRTDVLVGNADASPEPIAAPQPKKKPATTKYRRDFQPAESTLAWARDHGWQGDAFEHEFERFADWHVAKGSRMASWDQALMNWLRKAEEINRSKVVPIRANGAAARSAATYDDYVAGLDAMLAGENA